MHLIIKVQFQKLKKNRGKNWDYLIIEIEFSAGYLCTQLKCFSKSFVIATRCQVNFKKFESTCLVEKTHDRIQ